MDRRLGVDVGITRLLLQVGALCVKTAKFEDGERIFRALRAFGADLPQVSNALVLLLMRQRRWGEALREQQAALAHFPDSPLSRTLLALIQRELGNAQWREQMEQALSAGREEWLAALSGSSLQQAFAQSSTTAPAEHERSVSAQTRRLLS